MWLNTPDPQRSPKTDAEAAEILGVSTYTLATWRRSPELTRIINSDTKQIALRCYPYVWEKVMEGVGRGDKGYADLALKHIKEIEAAVASGPKFPTLPQNLLDESKKICDDGTANRATGITDKVTKAAVYGGLVDGDIKPGGETVQ